MSAFGDFAAIAAEDGRAALVTVVEGGDLGAKLLVRADGITSGGLGDARLDEAGVEAAEVREKTGWPLAVADELAATDPPTDDELDALRELVSR